MSEQPHGPTPLVIATQWAARIMTLALEMVFPGLLGVWADARLGTKVVFTLLGFGLGCVLAIWQLIRVASGNAGRSGKDCSDSAKRITRDR